jgi:flagellar motility protein MotE (MotC chaperone)
MSEKTNIFFPENLSPQGFLTDMILAQMRSPSGPFSGPTGLKAKIYGEDFSKVTGNKLFFLHPDDRSKLLKKPLPKTAKKNEGLFQNDKRDYTMRRYINFLNNMTPAQQAVLVPYIRLYTKTFQGKKFLRSREIVFNKEYRIPNVDPAAGLFNNGGKGNAGIEDMQVSRDFQYYGVTNRYSVEMSFFFDSFETFANGMQYDNSIGRTIDAIADGNAQALLGQDQGSGYISLIKKGSKKDETGNPIREYLFLEYGYKFPDNIDPNIVSPEDRVIFETQEKKELRLTCYKHDFRFSETGEVALQVSYVAAPEAAMGTRDEEKTNDVFLISNKGIIDEIMDEQPGTDLKIIQSLKDELRRIKQANDERKKLLQNYCRDDEDDKDISKIDEDIKEANKLINSKKKALLAYVEHFFMRYFMKKNSLWNISFQLDPYEAENKVIEVADNVFYQSGDQTPTNVIYKLRLNKVNSDKVGVSDDDIYTTICDYQNKINELKDKNHFVPAIDDSYVPKTSVLKEEEIKGRFTS